MTGVNIRLLASELNLSIGTVSKALKDSYEISDETKKRVQEMAKKLNYIPNPYASSLRRKKSNTIAVVVPEVADSFFSQAIKGIEEEAQQRGYHVLIYLSHESFEREQEIMEQFKHGRVDGLLMSVSGETCSSAHIDALEAENIPVVFFDRTMDTRGAKIVTNDFESSYNATEHLIGLGCRKIVYLSISNLLDINTKRVGGFEKAMASHNIELTENSVINCFNSDKENEQLLSKLLSEDLPEAIIASVEKLVTPVYSICHERGIKIPGNLKILCFSNLTTAHILNPSLTTITQPAFEMGKIAATTLFKALEKPGFKWQSELQVIPSTLHIRESTAG